MKKSSPPKDIHYFNMGPWPGYVGFTTSPKAFAAEMKRLKIDNAGEFLQHARSDATTHFLTTGTQICCIITMPAFKPKRCSREQYAALVAHEAMHVVQEMQNEYARGKSLGSEAEAYLIQQIVQECLQIAWKSDLVTRREPA